MQEKSNASKSNILILLNNYSYFKKSEISGPKSIIQLLKLLDQNGVSLTIMLPGEIPKASFPFNSSIYRLRFKHLISNVAKADLLLVDRHFFVLGWFLAKIFRKKLCVRLLGLGNRLGSTRILSKRNLLSLLTRLSPIELLISTLDASGSPNSLKFIKSKKILHRINGIENDELVSKPKNLNRSLFFFVGRDSPEKGLKEVIEFFNTLSLSSKKLDIFGNDPLFSKNSTDKLTPNIKYHGFVKQSQIRSLTTDHAFMISGNKLGAMGNAELEALARGKKVIYCGSKRHLSFVPNEIVNNYVHVSSWSKTDLGNLLNQSCEIPEFFAVHESDKNSIMELLP